MVIMIFFAQPSKFFISCVSNNSQFPIFFCFFNEWRPRDCAFQADCALILSEREGEQEDAVDSDSRCAWAVRIDP